MKLYEITKKERVEDEEKEFFLNSISLNSSILASQKVLSKEEYKRDDNDWVLKSDYIKRVYAQLKTIKNLLLERKNSEKQKWKKTKIYKKHKLILWLLIVKNKEIKYYYLIDLKK